MVLQSKPSVPQQTLPPLLRSARHWLLSLILVLGPAAMLANLWFPLLNRVIPIPGLAHFGIAGIAAVTGALLAVLVLQVAQRAQDSRVLVIGLTLLSSAVMFALHALTTPGVIFAQPELVVDFTARLTLVISGIGFGLSGLILQSRFEQWVTRHARLLIAITLGMLLLLAWLLLSPLALVSPGTVPTSEHSHTASSTASTSTAPGIWLATRDLGIAHFLAYAGFIIGILQHYRFYRKQPTGLGLAIVSGIALFGTSMAVQSIAAVFSPLFWIYHFTEVSAFGVISSAVLLAYQHRLVDETLLESLFLPHTRQRIQANFAHAFDELTLMLSNGAHASTAQRLLLSERFGMTESQIQVMERAAAAVARERQQREELEQLNQALQQLERDKDQLTQMVVHDLKNPLTALVGFLELLRLDKLSAGQRELLEYALRSGRNLSGLIGDLLDVAQMNEGQLRLNRTTIAIRALLESCGNELDAWIAQENKHLQIECDHHLLVAVDERLLGRMLLNLISNAIKHTPPHTLITMRAYVNEADCQLQIEVHDTGPGIPPEQLATVFERFSRATARAAAQQMNTGLGLAFCQMAAVAHGGSIVVESNPTQGTTFRILLPHDINEPVSVID